MTLIEMNNLNNLNNLNNKLMKIYNLLEEKKEIHFQKKIYHNSHIKLSKWPRYLLT